MTFTTRRSPPQRAAPSPRCTICSVPRTSSSTPSTNRCSPCRSRPWTRYPQAPPQRQRLPHAHPPVRRPAGGLVRPWRHGPPASGNRNRLPGSRIASGGLLSRAPITRLKLLEWLLSARSSHSSDRLLTEHHLLPKSSTSLTHKAHPGWALCSGQQKVTAS